MTVAKRDGRTGMTASLGGDTPAITARSLRHSTPPQMAKVELRPRQGDGSSHSGSAHVAFGTKINRVQGLPRQTVQIRSALPVVSLPKNRAERAPLDLTEALGG